MPANAIRTRNASAASWERSSTASPPNRLLPGRAVRIEGYEVWTFDADGLIAESKGHYDEAEYRRQVSA